MPAEALSAGCESFDDSALIGHYRDGDDGAFTVLFSRYQRQLRSYFKQRALGGDPDDLVQETMISAMKGLPNFQVGRKFQSWLYGIASHKLIDHYRNTGRKIRHTDIDHVPEDSEALLWAEDPSHIAERREDRARIDEMVAVGIARLSDKQRDALMNRFLDEREHAYVSASMGITSEQLSQVLFDAKERLGDVLVERSDLVEVLRTIGQE